MSEALIHEEGEHRYSLEQAETPVQVEGGQRVLGWRLVTSVGETKRWATPWHNSVTSLAIDLPNEYKYWPPTEKVAAHFDSVVVKLVALTPEDQREVLRKHFAAWGLWE